MSSIDNYHNFCIAFENARQQQNLQLAELWWVAMDHTPPLRWDDSDGRYRVIVAHLASAGSPLVKKNAGDKFPLSFDLWVTLVPQIQEFWRAFKRSNPDYKGTMLKRIQQYMGFPLDFITPFCIEIAVDQADLIRPCVNPNPGYVRDPRNIELDSHCFTSQDLEKHKRFMENVETLYYPSGDGEPLFPWTRLGYTYDWYNLNQPVGASEFVIRSGAKIHIHSIQRLEEYLNQ